MAERLYFWLQVAASSLRTLADRSLEAEGLTSTQMGALFVIGERGSCLSKDLASALRVNASAVTPLVARLVRDGFVLRERSADDGRAHSLSLTPAGAQAVTASLPKLMRLNQGLQEGFSDEELAVVGRFLRHATEHSRQLRKGAAHA